MKCVACGEEIQLQDVGGGLAGGPLCEACGSADRAKKAEVRKALEERVKRAFQQELNTPKVRRMIVKAIKEALEKKKGVK